jgi:HTH-type transcriptional regulator/antitoxin HigA
MATRTRSSSSASRTTTEAEGIDPRLIRSHRPGEPAEVFPPGDFIREELEARGWTQADLAAILGRPVQVVNAIINAKKAVTPRTAIELGAAFGTSPELWINLETSYRLRVAGPPDPAIAQRAAARLRQPARSAS